jgi:hypothetical protein
MAQRRNCGGKGNCRTYKVVEFLLKYGLGLFLNIAN